MDPIYCIASAPGKAILFGEHSVVHGTPAIAAALSDLRVKVSAACLAEDRVILDLSDIKDANGKPVTFSVATSELLSVLQGTGAQKQVGREAPEVVILDALDIVLSGYDSAAKQGLKPLLYLCVAILLLSGAVPGLAVKARRVKLPVGAGLGSSAAFCVASAMALVGLQKKLQGESLSEKRPLISGDQDLLVPAPEIQVEVNDWAFLAETIVHGTPSGMDNTISTFGGAMRYVKTPFAMTALQPVPSLNILVVNTLVPRSTRMLVAAVREKLNRMEEAVRHIFLSIGNITDTFAELASGLGGCTESKKVVAEAPQASEWGTAQAAELFRLNHSLLRALDVSHPALETVVGIAEQRGFAAKLTGAGGGGCALVLLQAGQDPKPSPDVVGGLKRSMRWAGFDCIESSLGGVGAAWHVRESLQDEDDELALPVPIPYLIAEMLAGFVGIVGLVAIRNPDVVLRVRNLFRNIFRECTT